MDTAINAHALTDPTHPQHHVSVAQVLGLVMLGLSAYQVSKTQGPSAFLDPAKVSPYIQGILSLFPPA